MSNPDNPQNAEIPDDNIGAGGGTECPRAGSAYSRSPAAYVGVARYLALISDLTQRRIARRWCLPLPYFLRKAWSPITLRAARQEWRASRLTKRMHPTDLLKPNRVQPRRLHCFLAVGPSAGLTAISTGQSPSASSSGVTTDVLVPGESAPPAPTSYWEMSLLRPLAT